ncbi:DUF1453 domain-containing protein [Kineococcus sp. SYSU DK003]|uniref:DUF1453 domain-containing protein n=1 Tax=Kineococcus sp. SYSU DK003 TaxID=3383124 RepID=UPI003D7C9B5A
MSPLQMTALIALSTWAVYQQTRTMPITHGARRFALPALYAGTALIVGGFGAPHDLTGWALLLTGLALSVAVGIARARLTRVWTTSDGRVLRRGTAVTVGLFLGLIAAKFALGALAWAAGTSTGGGFGQILLMIAVMVAVQAELLDLRSRQAARFPASRITAADRRPTAHRPIPRTRSRNRRPLLGVAPGSAPQR